MGSRHSVRGALLGSIGLAALTLAQPALAQDATTADPAPPADSQTTEEAAAASDTEIVVTARRRNEILLDVPIAVTAYSGEQLERQGALDITDVGDTTPNVNLETSRGTNTTLTAFIRGVGQQDPVAGFEQGVGIYIDDVYLNRPQGALLDIYDVERIEILRGPQGTLYGRNTIGGAVKYVTRRLPKERELRMRANLGTYEQADLILSVAQPLSDAFRIGGAFARLSRGGFGKNLTTGQENYNKDIYAARGTLEFEPAESAFLRLSGDYTWDDSNTRGGHRLIPGLRSGAPVLDDEFDSRGALLDPKQKVKGGGAALHGEVGLNDWLKLKSITAYRKDRSDTPIDFDALPATDVDVPAIYKNKQFSQEVQAVIERGPLAGIVGAYYLNADAQTTFDVRLYTTLPTILPGLTALTHGDVGTKTWAVFGDFSYDFTEQLSASLGGRYTNDKRDSKVFRQTLIRGGSPTFGGAPPFGFGVGFPASTNGVTSDFEGKRTDTAFTPRASIAFKPNRDHNIYASYARGFKGGGFDPRGLTTSAPDLNGNRIRDPEEIYEFMAFDPETVDSYELGWKGSVFDRRLNFALAVFQADYKDVQVPGSVGGSTLTGVPTFVGVTTNAGQARFRGVELESNLRVGESLATAGDRLNLAGTLGYLEAEYREFITVVNRNPAGASITPIEVDMADFREVQNTPKWTMSGSVDYDTPVGDGRLNANATLSYRSKSQQFELASPGLDQKGFALLDANLVWRSDRFTVGLHGKNLTNKKYITAGYNFLNQNPYTGEYIGRGARVPNGQPGLDPTLGTEGVLTAYYGNPRQLFLSLGVNF
ncbi:TonB-dependent receptor [Sphingomonas sp.]|uniref:TonB-dependent receptor n=1 Tax=Sphingomonas sp. TaxID=28214 RepID=UPI0017D613B2|nr:TonB-dependent receptor [Sphingomonas sp.]MBA3510570.1 TonB-dependent receptor [Sphingomonas sp.]